MEQKIFNDSWESRIKLNLKFNQDYWCIRSAHSIHAYFIGFVSHRVTYNNVRLDFGILPVCTI